MIRGASVPGAQGAGVGNTDRLQLGALGRYDRSRRGAANTKDLAQGHAHSCHIFGCNTEGRGCESDLGDEVAHLILVKVHESEEGLLESAWCKSQCKCREIILMDIILAASSTICREAILSNGRAAEENAKKLVQMGQ